VSGSTGEVISRSVCCASVHGRIFVFVLQSKFDKRESLKREKAYVAKKMSVKRCRQIAFSSSLLRLSTRPHFPVLQSEFYKRESLKRGKAYTPKKSSVKRCVGHCRHIAFSNILLRRSTRPPKHCVTVELR
jgi:hypothetical protein